MKGGVIKEVVVMKSLYSNIFLPSLCIAKYPSWKLKKHFYNGSKITAVKDLKQLTEELSDEENFSHNLDTILIPRTVGSKNLTLVRKHIKRVLRNNGWSVEDDSFRNKTPHGMK